eukprot:TRINITY_DN8845_c0_g1_i2.p1 TRINITY_DN8845_c0_g1~~TRINITY_DN8845_c0_g1_i2.p1  ORF type:complete len:351 (+),score=47.53 TRINITY_DN8845_c0_g1_i2:285-1337(+)
MNRFSFRRSRRNRSSRHSTASTAPKLAMLGRTDEEEGFFDLILKLQGGSRMENQRSTGPRQGGDLLAFMHPSAVAEPEDEQTESFATPAQSMKEVSLTPEQASLQRRISTRSSSLASQQAKAAAAAHQALYEAPSLYESADPAIVAELTEIDPAQQPAINRSVSLRAPASQPAPMPQRAASQRARPLPSTPPRPSLGPGAPLPSLGENNAPAPTGKLTVQQEEAQLAEHTWYVGEMDRKKSEGLLRHWPTGTFVVRQGRSSRVITLRFPVAQDKTFFHVRITYEEPMYRVADTECFSTVPELIAFYVDKPHRFFRGMAPEERTKHKLLPYRPLPRLMLEEQPLTAEASEA